MPPEPASGVDAGSNESADQRGDVSVHISCILSGKLLARIDRRSLTEHPKVTALYYSEDSGDIITGDDQGIMTVWSVASRVGCVE